MDALFVQLSAIHPFLAVVGKVGVAAILLMVVWCLISLPLYFLSKGSAAGIQAGQSWLDSLLSICRSASSRIVASLHEPFARFATGHSMRFLFDEAERAVQHRIKEVADKLQALKEAVLAKNDKTR